MGGFWDRTEDVENEPSPVWPEPRLDEASRDALADLIARIEEVGGRVHPAPCPSPEVETKMGHPAPGDSGAGVSYLQERLRAHGYSLRVNGRFDAATERRVRDFQRQNRLRINGIVDDATWEALCS